MKDREESSIECLRLTVRIRYSLYRISFLAHPPTLMIPHKTHTHTFVCVCVCVYMSLLLLDCLGKAFRHVHTEHIVF